MYLGISVLRRPRATEISQDVARGGRSFRGFRSQSQFISGRTKGLRRDIFKTGKCRPEKTERQVVAMATASPDSAVALFEVRALSLSDPILFGVSDAWKQSISSDASVAKY